MSYCRTKVCAVSVAGFFLILTVVSCESERQPATFYPVDSLITGQASYLAGIRAGLFKEALLGEEADTVRLVPTDSVWRQELEIFRKLEEINKPVNKGIYRVRDGLRDPGSNLTVKAFEALKEDVPVVYLKIFYQGSIDKPRKIEALYEEENLLFEGGRFLSMQFRQIGGRSVLTSYAVRGGQKMVFGDTVAFYIGGKVLME